jgi:hypothetical protein
VNTEPNPISPNQSALAPSTFDLEEMGKKDARWRLEIRPGDLAFFEADDPHPFLILHDKFYREAVLVENMKLLTLKTGKKATFKLTPEATAAIAQWLGKSMLASFYLRRRYAWIIPVAAIWIIGSLPIAGNPQAGIDAKPLDLIGLCMGFALVIAWAIAKWRPHPILFLVDSFWFLCLAGYLINDVVHGRSKYWLLLVALSLWLVLTGLKYFARFRTTRLSPL